LSRHDVHAEIVRITGDASATIMTHASSGRFDYLVMGGFGHRRFVERMFGGVTKSLLAHSPVPLFLAH